MVIDRKIEKLLKEAYEHFSTVDCNNQFSYDQAQLETPTISTAQVSVAVQVDLTNELQKLVIQETAATTAVSSTSPCLFDTPANTYKETEPVRSNERKSRKCYTTKEKIKILKLYETTYNFNASLTASKCNIDPSMVVRWYKKRAILYHSLESKKKICRGPSSMYPQLEDMLFDWLFEQKAKKKAMSYNKIRLQAKSIVANTSMVVDPEFKFSNSWIRNFFKRFSFEHKKKFLPNLEDCDPLLEERQRTDLFLGLLQPIATQYELQFMYSMDEIPIFLESDYDSTLQNSTNSDNLVLKSKANSKKKFSVFLTVTAAGTVLPAYLVMRNAKNVAKINMPENVVVNTSAGNLIGDKLMCDYLEKILEPIGDQAPKSMILLNEHKTDFTEMTNTKMNNMRLLYRPVPGDLTMLVQTLNASINKKFISMYEDHLHKWYGSDTDSASNSANGFTVKKPSEQWLVDTISICVKKLQLEVELIKSSFELCGIVKKNRLW